MFRWIGTISLFWWCLHLDPSHGFVPVSYLLRSSSRLSPYFAMKSSEEAAIKAFTEYMVRAHEEKLRAVRLVEEAKDAEIQALQTQLASLMAQKEEKSNIPSANSSFKPKVVRETGSLEELQQKLGTYQQFMSKYIVEAQEAKLRAAEEARISITQKYEGLISELSKSTVVSVDENPKVVAESATDVVTTPLTLYEKRNANVQAAAAAGQSRWGDAEVNRIASYSTSPKTKALANPSLYEQRNARLTLTNRWGIAEIERVMSPSGLGYTPPLSPTLPPAEPASLAPPVSSIVASLDNVPAEVSLADHGMRNDGGVGGLSLAERVVGGALALELFDPSSSSSSSLQSLYQRRCVKVAQTPTQQSRWGPMEQAKALETIGTSTPAIDPDVVMMADHGLRADGGVGGPTLADRVNLGARLMGMK